jgi:tetratricopeptide (TPR) repeat protein
MKRGFKSSDCHGRRWFAGFSFADSWFEVVLTLLGLIYVADRVIRLPLATDEWGVLYSIYHHHFADHFTATDWKDWNAQAQLLNLVLSRTCFHLFRFNEIQRIRIPSLLSFGVFLCAIWRLRGQFTRRLVGRLAFVALLSNAFVLDYFGVSRGYGLAMAFATLSLAALFEAGDGNGRWAFWAAGSAALAAVSNLSFLYFAVAILLSSLFLLRRESFSRRFWLAVSALVLGVFYLPRVIVMQRHNLFYFGGTSGFVSDTVVSLVKCLFYEGSPFYPFPTSRLEAVLAWVVVGLVMASALGLFWGRDRRGSQTSICLLAIVAMIFASHSLLRVRYPVERAAMYFIPLFVIQVACLADSTRHRWLRSGLSGLLVAYSVVAAWGLNLTHMCVSKVMADIPALVEDLKRIHEDNRRPVVLCLSDGTKWQVWYYAELATQLPENERLQDRECYARIDWLHVFEPHCGLPTERGRLSTAATTHLFLSSDDCPPTWFLHDTVFVREYPVSHWRLYARVGDDIPRGEEALQVKPDYADGHFSQATVLMQEGKFGEAVGQYEQALRIKPDYVEAHSNLGMALARTGKIEEAIAQYEQALRIDPDFAPAHSNLGVALARAGRIGEAIAQYEQALRIDPDFAEVHYDLGVLLTQMGRIEEAIAHYGQALRIKSEYAEAHYNLGVLLAQTGKIQEAIAQFEQALRIQPEYAEAHYNLGVVLAQTGKIQEAVAHFEEALRIQPDFTLAQQALAQLQARP